MPKPPPPTRVDKKFLQASNACPNPLRPHRPALTAYTPTPHGPYCLHLLLCCAWVQFWGPQSDSETGTRTREPNLVTRMGAQSSPTSDLNDWGRHCGSHDVEFLWLQNSARSAARKLVTLLLLALRKLPRKRSQKRSRKSYASLANPVPCSCPNVPAARLD